MENVIITFTDGSTLEAELNGTTYIVDTKPEFPSNLSTVTIERVVPENASEEEKRNTFRRTIQNARIIDCASIDGRYWFAIIPIPQDELDREMMQGQIDYLALMCGVELY